MFYIKDMQFKKKVLKDQIVGIRLDSETIDKLNRLAKKIGITKSELIRQMIENEYEKAVRKGD